MRKKERQEKLKRERQLDAKFSTNKKLNYKIHQMTNRIRKGDKGHGCAMESMRVMRERYPELLTRQSGGTGRIERKKGEKK